MPGIAFVIWSVLVPAIGAGVVALVISWLARRRAESAPAPTAGGEQDSGSGRPGLVLALWATVVGGYLLGFLLYGDYRAALARGGLRTPGFLCALVPSALLPLVVELWAPRRWRWLAWPLAGVLSAVLLYPAFMWGNKPGGALPWFGGAVLATLVGSAILSAAVGRGRWSAPAGLAAAMLVLAPLAVTYQNAGLVIAVDLLVAPLVAVAVGSAVAGGPFPGRVSPWPVLLPLFAGLAMVRVHAVPSQVVWGPLVLLLLAPLVLVGCRRLPLDGGRRRIAIGLGTALWLVLVLAALGWSYRVYTSATGSDEEVGSEYEDAYGL